MSIWLPLAEMRINCCQNSSGRRNRSPDTALISKHARRVFVSRISFLIDLPYVTLSGAPKIVFRNHRIGMRQCWFAGRWEHEPTEVSFWEKRFFETRKLHSCQMNDTANGPGPCKVQADLFLSAWTLQKIHFEVSFFETKLWNLDVNKQ